MDNRSPPDELLSSVLASPQSQKSLSTTYACLSVLDSADRCVNEYRDLDFVRKTLSVLNVPDDGIDHIVYADDHSLKGQEAHFVIPGYVVSFNVPCHTVSGRCVVVMKFEHTSYLQGTLDCLIDHRLYGKG